MTSEKNLFLHGPACSRRQFLTSFGIVGAAVLGFGTSAALAATENPTAKSVVAGDALSYAALGALTGTSVTIEIRGERHLATLVEVQEQSRTTRLHSFTAVFQLERKLESFPAGETCKVTGQRFGEHFLFLTAPAGEEVEQLRADFCLLI